MAASSGPAFRTTGQPYETAELRRMVRENTRLKRLLEECNKQIDSIRVESPRRRSPTVTPTIRVSPITRASPTRRTPAPKKTPKKSKYTFTPRTVGIHTPKYTMTPRRRKPPKSSPPKVRTPTPPKVKTPPRKGPSLFSFMVY